jgi:ornithine carbamoyltransferase
MNDFLSIRELTGKQLRELIDLAIHIKSSPDSYAYALKGLSMAMIFEKPSLRTRVTFDIGMHQLGGHALYLSPAEISLGKRETIHDVAKNLERMVDVIMIRTFAHESVEELAHHASIPVINGLTDYSHPCQAVADFMTVLEAKGKLAGVKLAYLGDGNNVARSLMFAGALLGCHVCVCTPRGYEPDLKSVDWAQKAAKASGGSCVITNDCEIASANADVIYTDVWASMGQEAESEVRARIFRPYQVTSELFCKAHKDAMFLHCLPAHRGEEVSAKVIDSPRSWVFQEAENRLHAQKAILYTLLHDRPSRRIRSHAEEFASV